MEQLFQGGQALYSQEELVVLESLLLMGVFTVSFFIAVRLGRKLVARGEHQAIERIKVLYRDDSALLGSMLHFMVDTKTHMTCDQMERAVKELKPQIEVIEKIKRAIEEMGGKKGASGAQEAPKKETLNA